MKKREKKGSMMKNRETTMKNDETYEKKQWKMMKREKTMKHDEK